MKDWRYKSTCKILDHIRSRRMTMEQGMLLYRALCKFDGVMI